MNLRQLLRAARWARRPPSPRRVAMVLAAVALSLALAGLERAGLLPGWFGAATERVARDPAPAD